MSRIFITPPISKARMSVKSRALILIHRQRRFKKILGHDDDDDDDDGYDQRGKKNKTHSTSENR